MKRSPENKRLSAIKEKKPIFHWKKCECCGYEFKREQMFVVYRWGFNRTIREWWYCKNCTPTKEDVLNRIDNDSCMYGIANVDSYFFFNKKGSNKWK